MTAGLVLKKPPASSKKRVETPANTRVFNGGNHPPFIEFQVKTLEDLLSELEKSKPEGSLVEVTPIEEMHHTPCMQEMSTIVIHGDETGRLTRPDELLAVYQYCAECKSAVRII